VILRESGTKSNPFDAEREVNLLEGVLNCLVNLMLPD
jgi:hypothetical protein